MILDQGCEVQASKDVAIADEKGLVSDPGFDVFQPSSGFKQDRFVEEGQGRPPVGASGESLLPLLGQVMGVDGKFLDPGSETIIKSIFDQRAVKNRDERFWENVGKGAQACAQASSQHKGFLYRGAHGGRGLGSLWSFSWQQGGRGRPSVW